MRVDVDQDVCCGSGMCVMTAPEVFDQRESDGVVTLLREEPEPGSHEVVREAARACPTGAIRLTD